MYICICITESLCCIPETQLCKSTIINYKIKINKNTTRNKGEYTSYGSNEKKDVEQEKDHD